MLVVAYDTFYPNQRATANAIINIIRNPNCPVFSQQSYFINVNQNTPVGGSVVQLIANDNDGVSL